VVEKTALAEAEVEYEDYTSDTVWVAFPPKQRAGRFEVVSSWEGQEAFAADLDQARVVIWTTTPWTLPGNRAIALSKIIQYGLYEVTESPDGNWAKVGDKFVVARKLAADFFQSAKVVGFVELHSDQSRHFMSHRLKATAYAHPRRRCARRRLRSRRTTISRHILGR